MEQLTQTDFQDILGAIATEDSQDGIQLSQGFQLTSDTVVVFTKLEFKDQPGLEYQVHLVVYRAGGPTFHPVAYHDLKAIHSRMLPGHHKDSFWKWAREFSPAIQKVRQYQPV